MNLFKKNVINKKGKNALCQHRKWTYGVVFFSPIIYIYLYINQFFF